MANNLGARIRGAFSLLFPAAKLKPVKGYFAMLDGYSPIFTSADGGVYEMELTRACIHAFATHASKLQPFVSGADTDDVQFILDNRVNPFMTTAQFLYKVATIYEAQNTCWIVPLLDRKEKLLGYYPLNPMDVEIVQVEGTGQPYIRYTFKNGDVGAMELEKCGVISKYLYNNDLVGEDNEALQPTLDLMALQTQGIKEGIKNGASFRFMATSANFAKASDLAAERNRFVAESFSTESGGLALFPNTYKDIKQITANPQVVDPQQMKIINERVFDYFGANEDILQNKALGDAWAAYYEGKIEPFAIQLSEALTQMTYSANQIKRGNAITLASNRLQYMTNKDKLEASSTMFDRGVFTLNDVLDIWNLPHVENGDRRYIRREYVELSRLDNGFGTAEGEENPPQLPEPEAQQEPAPAETGTEGPNTDENQQEEQT